MGIFIRTLIITLIICIGYYFYVLIGKESYSPTLEFNKTTINRTVEKKQTPKTQTQGKNQNQTQVSICLMSPDNKAVIVKRNAKENTLEYALKELISGSKRSERLNGEYSEIPKATKLLSFKEYNDKIIINLSKEFAGGGGAQSIQARLLQLVKTVNLYKENKPVYLYLEGEPAEYIGGEGIFVEQPLNEEDLSF